MGEVFPVFAEATAKQEMTFFVAKKGCIVFVGYDKIIKRKM